MCKSITNGNDSGRILSSLTVANLIKDIADSKIYISVSRDQRIFQDVL